MWAPRKAGLRRERGIVERLAAMRDLPGVLSADLVYHRVLPSSPGD